MIGVEDPTRRLTGLGGQAVNGFFIISGYLIAASAWRMRFLPYLWRRVIRILPAFWTVLVITAFVFAPVSTLFTGETWTLWAALQHIRGNALLYITEWGVPGTLERVPYPDVWNGPLWSLFYEFAAYIATGLLLMIGWVRRHGILVFSVLFAFLVVAQPLAHGPLDVTTNLYLNAIRLAAFFVAGSLFYAARDKVPLSTPWGAASIIVFCLLAYLNLDWWYGQLPMAYALLWLGSVIDVPIGRANDISYGIYIYGFPMQQFTYLMIGTMGGWVLHSVLALALTIPLAAVSWFFIEKPAMKLRNLVPATRRSA